MSVIKLVAWVGTAAVLMLPGQLIGQAIPETAPRSVPLVGVFGGLGSGPIEAAALGLRIEFPLWKAVWGTAEISGWGNGIGDTQCIAMPPYSHRCGVSGVAGLLGIGAIFPLTPRIGAYGQGAGGVFSRDWIDERVNAGALSVEGGLRPQIHERVYGSLAGRFLRVFDDDYRALLDEDLQYAMVLLGVSYQLGR